MTGNLVAVALALTFVVVALRVGLPDLTLPHLLLVAMTIGATYTPLFYCIVLYPDERQRVYQILLIFVRGIRKRWKSAKAK